MGLFLVGLSVLISHSFRKLLHKFANINQLKIMISKKTNVLLGIIATCLVLLTLIQLDVWPTKANANEFGLDPSINYGLVPLNEDGSINVNIASDDPLNVNVSTIRGRRPAMGKTNTGMWVLGTVGPGIPTSSVK